jgi:hypothetical protein
LLASGLRWTIAGLDQRRIALAAAVLALPLIAASGLAFGVLYLIARASI